MSARSVLSIFLLLASGVAYSGVVLVPRGATADNINSLLANSTPESGRTWIRGVPNSGLIFDFQGFTYSLDKAIVIPSGGNIVLRNGNLVASSSIEFMVKTGSGTDSRFSHHNLRVENMTVDGMYNSGGFDFEKVQTLVVQNVVVRNIKVNGWGIKIGGETIHPILDHVQIWGGTPYSGNQWDAFDPVFGAIQGATKASPIYPSHLVGGTPYKDESKTPHPEKGRNGLWVYSATDGHFTDVFIWGCNIGVRHSSQEDHFRALHVSLSVYGLWIDGFKGSDAGYSVNSTFEQCDFDDASVYVQNVRGVKFLNSIFRCPLGLISDNYPLLLAKTWNAPLDNFTITGCRFDGPDGKKAFDLDYDYQTGIGTNIVIRDNTFPINGGSLASLTPSASFQDRVTLDGTSGRNPLLMLGGPTSAGSVGYLGTRLGGIQIGTEVNGYIPNHLGLMVTSGGKIGVGLLNPEAKLDVDGGIKLGPAPETGSKEGTLRWNAATHKLQLFDGTSWKTVQAPTP